MCETARRRKCVLFSKKKKEHGIPLHSLQNALNSIPIPGSRKCGMIPDSFRFRSGDSATLASTRAGVHRGCQRVTTKEQLPGLCYESQRFPPPFIHHHSKPHHTSVSTAYVYRERGDHAYQGNNGGADGAPLLKRFAAAS